MDRGACRGHDINTFFPDSEDMRLRQAQVAEAKGICAGCPVKAPCLKYAIVHDEDGIWGGLAQQPRRRLARMMVTEVL